METMKRVLSLHGQIVVFMVLTSISKGLTCEAPSSPECFRRDANKSMYECQWSMNTTESDVTFDFYFDEEYVGSYKQTSALLHEERLYTRVPVNIWVEAHVGNSSCTSTRSLVVLGDIVKYETPPNITMFWVKNVLNLSWKAAESHPALAEVRFRQHEHPTESWENRLKTTNTTDEISMYQLSLSRNSAYKVQIRQKSTQAVKPLWSDWSPVLDVPAELTEKPDVSMTIKPVNGTREVILNWKPMPHAAAITGVTYSLNNSQSSRGCPCAKRVHHINTNKHTFYVSYSAVNISVVAKNAAGFSPPAVLQLPGEPAADLKECDKTLELDKKLYDVTCLEWYELQDGDLRPESVITIPARKKEKERKQIRENLKDFVRYVYAEHKCVDKKKPQTVKMCLFYSKEHAPLTAPQDFNAFGETLTSTNLSWKAIPTGDQRGFLKHYSLCSVKISSQDESGASQPLTSPECQNISASLTTYRVENLSPATKYIISLAGVTRGGEGPNATFTISTLPEKPLNVWWSLSLLIMFFLLSTMCTFILKRIKTKLFPPVPTPVIDFTSYPTENQEMLERKEEVHELTLHKLLTEVKSVPEDFEETTVLGVKWDDGSDEDVETERGDSSMSGEISDEAPGLTDEALRSSKDRGTTDLEQLESEFAMLIYRNGLVFDVKTDSP
uniref:oncostatin-M-specific receptor subunit beta n=1 Tax=Semicossyphus pulcher TaxID=241346 RepID=UPI0037E731E1